MIDKFKLYINRNFILILILLSIIFDFIWLINNDINPAWDQGFHLSNLFRIYNQDIFNTENFFGKWENILNVTSNYRGPFTYILSSFALRIFGNSYTVAYLSNHIFNIITILSIFKLGSILNNRNTGLWASLIFTFSPFIVSQRTDYLIDLSLTSVCTLFILSLTLYFLDTAKVSFYALISGLILGLIFLTKPTGICIFFIPLVITFYKKILNRNNEKFYLISEIVLFFLAFYLVINPWFSRHWLTIISSTVNAFSWGIKYQEGLDLNSNDKDKLEIAFKNCKFDKYYQPHFIPGGEKTVKDGRKINWQKSIDMQLDDKINLFISDGGLRDPDRINALIEEIS